MNVKGTTLLKELKRGEIVRNNVATCIEGFILGNKAMIDTKNVLANSEDSNISTKYEYNDQERVKIFYDEFMPHIDSMYNFAYRLTFDEDDSKDLVQDTYLKAYRFVSSFQQGTNAKAWLYRILKNSFINDFRKKSKEPAKVDYQEVENFYNSDDVDDTKTVDLRTDSVKDMIGDEVSNALNSLAIDFRTVIILCDLEGFTYEEMAKILDIPIGTVRSRLHRARNLLKEKLKSYAQEMGFGKSDNELT